MCHSLCRLTPADTCKAVFPHTRFDEVGAECVGGGCAGALSVLAAEGREWQSARAQLDKALQVQ